MENNDDDTAEDARKGSEGGTSESSSEANNSPTHVYAGFGSQPSNRVPLASLADAQIGMDPNFSRLSPSFECKEANPSDNLTVDQDMNPVEDFPDTDSTALIKELSEEVFSIGATPSLGGQHSSDDEIWVMESSIIGYRYLFLFCFVLFAFGNTTLFIVV